MVTVTAYKHAMYIVSLAQLTFDNSSPVLLPRPNSPPEGLFNFVSADSRGRSAKCPCHEQRKRYILRSGFKHAQLRVRHARK